MRIYIIGTDGITLCREAPATLGDGEIVVASKQELHAALARGRDFYASDIETATISGSRTAD